MIGTIRHQGFIPWDDDIDVFMVRSEFNKFLKAVKKSNSYIAEHYKVFLPFNDDYYYTYPKIVDTRTEVYEKNKAQIKGMGLWIDVFPIDYCSNNEEDGIKYAEEQMSLMLKYYKFILKYPNNNFGGFVRNVLLQIYKKIYRKVPTTIKERCEILSTNEEMKYSGTLTWCFSEKDVYLSNYFKDYEYGIFENQRVMIFKEYDKILTHRFGDYMELPKEEDRRGHSLVAEWKARR